MTTLRNLRNQQTRSSRVPIIDRLYAYDTKHTLKFSRRNEKGVGYPYIENGVPNYAGENEIHIYHRTAEIKGVSKGLTMVTKQSKYREVQKWFNEQIEAIEQDEGLFEAFSHAGTSPVELKLYYTYE